MFANPYSSPYSSPYSAPYSSPYSSPFSGPLNSYSSPYSSSLYNRPYNSGSPYGYGGQYGPDRNWPPANGMPPERPNGVLDTVHGGFQSVGSVTEGMARVTGMLDQNWQALFMSFTSLIRLFEGFKMMKSEFWGLLKAVSFVKLLHSLYQWIKGPETPLTNNVRNNVKDFFHRKPRRSPVRLLMVLGGITALLGPFLYRRLRDRILRQSRQQQQRLRQDYSDFESDSEFSSRSSTSVQLAECLFDFEPRSARELAVREGDVVRIAARVGHQWLAAEDRHGRRGLVPTDAVRPLEQQRRHMHQQQSKKRRRRRARHHDDIDESDSDRVKSVEKNAQYRREEALRNRVDSFDLNAAPSQHRHPHRHSQQQQQPHHHQPSPSQYWGADERMYTSDRDFRRRRRFDDASDDNSAREEFGRRRYSDDDVVEFSWNSNK